MSHYVLLTFWVVAPGDLLYVATLCKKEKRRFKFHTLDLTACFDAKSSSFSVSRMSHRLDW